MDSNAIIRTTPESGYCGYFCYSPFYGGRVTKLVLTKNGEHIPVLRALDSNAITLEDETFSNAVLVPFPNRLYNGCYAVEDRSYQLPAYSRIRPHAVHGLMYNHPADEVKELFGADDFTVEMITNYAKEVAGYPFYFQQTITYTLNNSFGFGCSVSVKNTGQETMPLGIGIHPYFICNTSINSVRLQLPLCQLIATDSDGFPTGVLSNYTRFSQPEPIKDQKFNDCFLAKPGREEVEITLSTDGYTLIYSQDYQTVRYFQLYIPPERNAIAIEPMTCSIDAFNNKQGLMQLQPGESASCSYQIRIA